MHQSLTPETLNLPLYKQPPGNITGNNGSVGQLFFFMAQVHSQDKQQLLKIRKIKALTFIKYILFSTF